MEAPPPKKLTTRHDVTCRAVGGFPVWTVRPWTGSGRAAVYLHGGAYISGIAPQHWALIGRLADAGVRVEVPLYGLAPQHTYRDANPFVHEVYRQLAVEEP
ncbi:alpha/beta hydrolase, partial [Blastococcus sp. CT_GayMR20]|uniref:alpha/beta hydrolase fold domain-containing protein n=1 Tax=Blastococcus sp. CT_GayMR20 TaxID=2559609 RepID=UPI001FD80DA9